VLQKKIREGREALGVVCVSSQEEFVQCTKNLYNAHNVLKTHHKYVLSWVWEGAMGWEGRGYMISF